MSLNPGWTIFAKVLLVVFSGIASSGCLSAELITHCDGWRDVIDWETIYGQYMYTERFAATGTSEANCSNVASAKASYGRLDASAASARGLQAAEGWGAATFEQQATFSGDGQGHLAIFVCDHANEPLSVRGMNVPYNVLQCGGNGPFGSEQWLPLNSSPIRFNVPLLISGYVDAGIPTSHGVQSMGPRPYYGYAHVSLEIVGIRAYDSDMRLTGEWTQMIQAPTATYVTTLATPEPSTLSMLTIAALGLVLIGRRY